MPSSVRTERPAFARLRVVTAGVLLFASVAVASTARADEIADFENARRAYESQEYNEAARRFEALVGGPVPRLRSRPLIHESRKYLGASYLFLGRRDAASREFQRLLEDDPEYQIDPIVFPREVVDFFSTVRDQIVRERAERERLEREAEQRRRREQAERLLRERERMLRLEELAATETVERVNSRVIATIPFGVGQFQNGDDVLGWTLLVSQAVLTIASVTTFILHGSLRDENPAAADRDDAARLEEAFRLTNWVSTGLLGGLIVGGIVHAHVRFEPVTRTARPRELPPELRDGDAVEPEPVIDAPEPRVDLSLGPFGAGLRVQF